MSSLTLQAYLGSYYINDFNIFGRVYKVMIQADGKFRDRVEDIGALYVRSSDGTMVPMRSILTTQNVLGPQILTRYNMFRSAAVMADPAPGASTGVVINEVEAAAAQEACHPATPMNGPERPCSSSDPATSSCSS